MAPVRINVGDDSTYSSDYSDSLYSPDSHQVHPLTIESTSVTREPIAVIGFALKCAQADSEEAFWSLLMDGRCTSSTFPENRLNISGLYHGSGTRKDAISAKGGHFVHDSIAAFDAPFFSISAQEAASMDPQQRGLLETTYKAFENAGQTMEDVVGSNTSTFTGCFTNDWKDLYSKDPEAGQDHATTGVMPTLYANRLSWFFNLKGCSANIDTACSSGLVALDLACRSLIDRESNMGVIGASNLIFAPDMLHVLESMNFLSPDSKCYSFDHRSNGYARGEGFAVIIVKRLSDALANGDTVRAVIRATGTNHDGYTPGITQPNMDSQEMLIRQTYQKAGLDPRDTSYFEAHGTGTAVGDPVEANALGKVFRQGRASENPLFVGAVKANVGHLEGASGLIGLIKSILVLEKGIIPPNTNFEKANSRIDTEYLKIKFPLQPTRWPLPGPRRASLNSFGFTGTNAHVVIEDAYGFLESHNLHGRPRAVPRPLGLRRGELSRKTESCQITRPRLLVWSAIDKSAVSRLASSYSQHFTTKGRLCQDTAYWDSLAYTLDSRRSSWTWRSFLILDPSCNIGKLDAATCKPVQSSTKPNLAFVFTGQGAQWARMGYELMEAFPVFRSSLIASEIILRSIGCPWYLLDELQMHKQHSNIDRPEYSQPICTAVQVAIVDLLRAWQVRPAAVVGHSSGEIAAAYCIEAIDHFYAIKVAYCRGLVAAMLYVPGSPRGAMMSVGLSEKEISPIILAVTNALERSGLAIGCINSPTNVTVSGDADQIDALKTILDGQSVFARKLQVDVAYHSTHMEVVAADYSKILGDGRRYIPQDERRSIKMVSSVTGAEVLPMELIRGDYWVANMTSPVKYSEAVEKLFSQSCKRMRHKIDGSHRKSMVIDAIVEIGPHAALKSPTHDILKALKLRSVEYTSVLFRHACAIKSALNCAGRLYCLGYPINLAAVNRPGGILQPAVLTDLPGYPFDHSQEYWFESRISRKYRLDRTARLDLLGKPAADWNALEPRWRNWIKASEMPWVEHHQVNGTILYPAAGMLVMAVEAAKQVALSKESIGGFSLKDVVFHTALVVPRTSEGVETQFQLRRGRGGSQKDTWFEFMLHTFEAGEFKEICNGLVCVIHKNKHTEVDGGRENLEELRRHRQIQETTFMKCNQCVSKTDLYQGLTSSGYTFGPTFQRLQNISYGSNHEARAEVDLFQWPSETHPQPHVIHPTSLDSILHLALAGLSNGGRTSLSTIVPTRIQNIWLSRDGLDRPNSPVVATSNPTKQMTNRGAEVSISVLDASGSSVRAQIEGFSLAVVSVADSNSVEYEESQLCHQMVWKADHDLLAPGSLIDSQPNDAGLPPPIAFHQDLAFATYVFISRALKNVDHNNVDLQPHLVKFIAWMRRQKKLYSSGDIAESQLHWEERSKDTLVANEIIKRVESANDFGNLTCIIGRQLPQILDGSIDPLQLLFEDNKKLVAGTYDVVNDVPCWRQFAEYMDSYAHKSPSLKILEIGAGTGGTTKKLLDMLRSRDNRDIQRYLRYDFTDISASFFEDARKLFSGEDRMEFRRLDIEIDPLEQGYLAGGYDMILAADVLHATQHLTQTLRNVRKLLKPGGKLVLYELTRPESLRSGFIWGTLPGWWLSSEDSRRWSPLLTPERWNTVLVEAGFSGTDLVLKDYEHEECYLQSIIVATAVNDRVMLQRRNISRGNLDVPRINVIADLDSIIQQRIAQQIKLEMKKLGYSCDVLSIRLASQRDDLRSSLNIFVQDVESSLLEHIKPETFAMLQHIVTTSKHVVWLSSGGGSLTVKPETFLVDGFSRVLRSEHQDIVFITIALEVLEPAFSQGQVQSVTKVIQSISSDCANGGYEPSYHEIDGALNIGRLIEIRKLGHELYTKSRLQKSSIEEFGSGPPLKLVVEIPGLLDTLHFVEDIDSRLPLGNDEIEIEVLAAGMNFADLIISLGKIPGTTLGLECAGIVKRIAMGTICDFHIGDRVCMTAYHAFATYARGPAAWACKIPDGMSILEAATIPVNFVTAWQCIHEIARIEQGETILIQSGAGGTGQAAIQIAQYHGAEVFVTVGSDDKKAHLISEYDIPEDHIFYSRDLSFAKGVRRMTGGKGVDVVLNSLGGESLVASWEIVKSYGRFVEIGKRDIHQNSNLPMLPFAKGVTFAAFDGITWMGDRPERMKKAMKTIMDLFASQKLRPVRPLHVKTMAEVEEGLRLLQDGMTSGKIIIEVKKETMVPTVLNTRPSFFFSRDETYVIAGGLGGLGRATARWMVDRGARNLMLLSRSGARTNVAKILVQDLQALGARIETPQCDVSDKTAFQATLMQYSDMPPIKGCIQASMVLADASFSQMTYEQWKAAIDPKVRGTWNIHCHLPRDLDFFIMLSSISGITGFPGQSNYAAGNTYQDALARYRVSQGQKAVSVDLGALAADGYLAEDNANVQSICSVLKINTISRAEYFALLDHYCDSSLPLLSSQSCQITYGLHAGHEPASWMCTPTAAYLTHVCSTSTSVGTTSSASASSLLDIKIRAFHAATSPSIAASLATDCLALKVSQTLNLDVLPCSSGTDTSDAEAGSEAEKLKPLHMLGVDSLLAIELRNWMGKVFGADVPIFEILGGGTLQSLGATVGEKAREQMEAKEGRAVIE